MRKVYFLLLLLVIFSASFANTTSYIVTQSGWRWRNNDGSETSATWKAAQQTQVKYLTFNEVVRLRIEIVNTSVSNTCQVGNCPFPITLVDSLQVTTEPGNEPTWKNVGLDASRPFRLAGTSSFIAQDAPTTTQITGNTYAFLPGKIMTTDSVVKDITLPRLRRTEIEWSIVGTAALVPNTVYYFRLRGRYGTAASAITRYQYSFPSLSTITNDPITAIGDITSGKAVVSVFPNPARSDINFKIESSPRANVRAVLCDLTGRTMHEQTFKHIQANTLTRLALRQQLAPGTYVLKLTADNFSQTIKVMIQ